VAEVKDCAGSMILVKQPRVRVLEKYAVRWVEVATTVCSGDGILIKDTHLAALRHRLTLKQISPKPGKKRPRM
jgi:nicotinate-nucleotide pyrophosphorylase